MEDHALCCESPVNGPLSTKAFNWACTMTWKGIKPVVTLVDKLYKKGIRLTKKEMESYENRIERSYTLLKWDVLIESSYVDYFL
jgi:hypothetical protein